MGRDTNIYAIGYVAKMIGEHVELLEQIAANSDNIDCGEMFSVAIGPDECITAFTSRGIESLQEFIADVRTWQGGIRQFLLDDGCEPETIERIMAAEPR
ncbi:MAG: hypothetical protein AAGF76_08975 [Pseudomonadota bacterium]